jgi:glycosyltransferase involved in cell wall biosynthesis
VAGGVDAQRFSPGRAPELRREWGVPEDAPLAGIVARMKPERGHDALLRAFALVLDRLPQAWLVLVGRGEHQQALRERAAELHVAHRSVFGGYRTGPELVAAYRALDVAVWLREGNDGACRGVLEAMACGAPVVAGNEGAPAELVPPSCGRVVDAEAPEAIAAALSELLGDLPLARRLGGAARTRATAFTHERAGEVQLAFYQRVRALPPVVVRGRP